MTKIREMWDNAPVNTDLAAVWVSGTIHTVRSETRMGSSGYEMTADLIEPYKLEEWSPI
jgi:hypothetical protein